MNFKPFFIHYNRGPGKIKHSEKRGFTAYVDVVDDDPRKCLVQIAFCSPKDQFVKSLGRQHAHISRVECINKRQLPSVLSAAQERCFNTDDNPCLANHYNYTLKYVV